MKTGLLIVNKPKDMTSHDVVSILRKKLNIKKIGHTGTLDPMATGVLPICIGKATRISEYIMQQGKAYIATLKFGVETDTYDITGKITNISDNKYFKLDDIKSALKKFIGEINQIPPLYSAIKVNGKKLYEYARNDEIIEVKSRKIKIYDIKILENIRDELKIYVKCSKGTYIRSLIHDLGKELNTFACMTDLQRVKVGNFSIEESFTINQLKKLSIEDIENNLVSISDSLYNLEEIIVDENISERLSNGQKINILKFEIKNIKQNEDIKVKTKDNFIGIGKVKDNILKMEKVFWQK